MDVIFNCPKCEQELAVDSTGAGTEINCPACGETIVIPAPEMVVNRPGVDTGGGRAARGGPSGQPHRLFRRRQGGNAPARAGPQDAVGSL